MLYSTLNTDMMYSRDCLDVKMSYSRGKKKKKKVAKLHKIDPLVVSSLNLRPCLLS